jgi:hypothetical protein
VGASVAVAAGAGASAAGDPPQAPITKASISKRVSRAIGCRFLLTVSLLGSTRIPDLTAGTDKTPYQSISCFGFASIKTRFLFSQIDGGLSVGCVPKPGLYDLLRGCYNGVGAFETD